MPDTFTDEQLADAKSQLESGTLIRDVLGGMGLQARDRPVLMREMRSKYGASAVREMLASSRAVPNFQRLPGMIARLQPRLRAAELDAMEANLDAAKEEIARIRSEL